MKQVLHIFKKDCRRFWPHLLGYGGVLAFLFYQAVNFPPPTEGSSLGFVSLLLNYGLPMILAALLVLEDPLPGRKAFWMTRPILWHSLLLAKVLFLMLFAVLVPLVVQAAALWTMGAEAGVFLPAAAASLVDRLPILGLAAALAALCRNLQVFVVAGAAVLAANAVLAEAFRGSFLQAHQRDLPFEAIWSQNLILPIALVGLAGLTVLYQYRTRRTLRTALILAIAYLAIALLVPFVQINLEWKLRHILQKPLQTKFQMRTLDSLPPGEQVSGTYTVNASNSHAYKTALFLGLVPVEPEHFLIRLSSVQGRFESEGLVLESWRDLGWLFGDLQAGLGPTSRTRPHRLHLTSIFETNPTAAEDWPDVVGQLRARLFFTGMRVSERARLPLVEGARFDEGPYFLFIESVRLEAMRLVIVLRQQSLYTRLWHLGSLQEQIVHPLSLSLGGNTSSSSSNRPVILPGCKVIHSRIRMEYPFRSDWKVDEKWLEDAELLVTQWVNVGVGDQIIEWENVRLMDLSLQAWKNRIRF